VITTRAFVVISPLVLPARCATAPARQPAGWPQGRRAAHAV